MDFLHCCHILLYILTATTVSCFPQSLNDQGSFSELALSPQAGSTDIPVLNYDHTDNPKVGINLKTIDLMIKRLRVLTRKSCSNWTIHSPHRVQMPSKRSRTILE